jgi:hypothetical protein
MLLSSFLILLFNVFNALENAKSLSRSVLLRVLRLMLRLKRIKLNACIWLPPVWLQECRTGGKAQRTIYLRE